MKTYLAAVAFAATLAQPAAAITFPSLTTIYVGSGVLDYGSGANTGAATTFHCSNVSGLNASIRFLVLDYEGDVVANRTFSTAHGDTITVSTHLTQPFSDISLDATGVLQGVVNIESTESGVFCTAFIVDAASVANMATRHLVRVNRTPERWSKVLRRVAPRRKRGAAFTSASGGE